MSASLFRTGLLPRLVLAVAFGVSAFGAVLLLERRSRPISPTPVATVAPSAVEPRPTAADGPERITIVSIAPVIEWRVRLDGETALPDHSSAYTWSAAPGAPADDLFVDVVTALRGEGPANALRVRLESPRLRIEWTEWLLAGEIARVSLEQLRTSMPAGDSSPAP